VDRNNGREQYKQAEEELPFDVMGLKLKII